MAWPGPLTARDPRARRDQRIAGELVVIPGTVKKHVSHLLGKAGAASRTEAVARARQLGLIRQRDARRKCWRHLRAAENSTWLRTFG